MLPQLPTSLFTTYWKHEYTRTITTFTRAGCDGPFTTLCDGVARAMCSPLPPQPGRFVDFAGGYWATSQTKKELPLPSTLMPVFPIPRPNCTVAPSDCHKLREYHVRKLAMHHKEYPFFNGYTWDPDWIDKEESRYSFWLQSQVPRCSNDTCMNCSFGDETVQFIQWHVEADESHLCGNSTTKVEARSIGPSLKRTAHWGTHTLTSPTVYAFHTSMRMGSCGSEHTDILVPLNPTEVSTMLFRSSTDLRPWGSVIDYRHLAYKTIGSLSYPMIPQSAYCGDDVNMALDECNTIYHDYRPVIVFSIAPEALSSIDPAWKYCENTQFAAYDPPIVLEGTVVALPTFPAPIFMTQQTPYPVATRLGLRPTETINSVKQSNDINIIPSVTMPNYGPATVPPSRIQTGAAPGLVAGVDTSNRRGHDMPNDGRKDAQAQLPTGLTRSDTVFGVSGDTFSAPRGFTGNFADYVSDKSPGISSKSDFRNKASISSGVFANPEQELGSTKKSSLSSSVKDTTISRPLIIEAVPTQTTTQSASGSIHLERFTTAWMAVVFILGILFPYIIVRL
jgi:hypothetical protein